MIYTRQRNAFNILKKSKQVFHKEHNDHIYKSQSQRADEQNKAVEFYLRMKLVLE